MKIAFLLMVLFMFSCNNSQHTLPVKAGVDRILGVYTNADGSKSVDVLLRQISKSIKFDSSLKIDKIYVDTIWGYPMMVQIKDSLGKPEFDSLKRPKTFLQYHLISKDSINWRVENISVDSLLKK